MADNADKGGHGPGYPRAGFTLIELMTVVGIIGVLSTVSAVSYDAARKFARDVRRVSDMNALQTALELYYDSHLSYPPDLAAGSSGLVLGGDRALVLSDGGFGPVAKGQVYLTRVPGDPGATGAAPYILRSVDADGSDCDKAPCAGYEIVFSLEGAVAGLAPGIHVLKPGGVAAAAAAPPGTLPTVSGDFATIALGTAARATFFFREAATAVATNPTVQTSAKAVVAPVATAGAVAAVLSAVRVAAIPRYLAFFFSQPYLFLIRRRREAYGVVYDALSKLPIDLAIVRLRDARSNAVVRSAVTDANGRFHFIADHGTYRIEVTKPGFRFPSPTLRDARTDGEYLDLYHGETVRVDQDGASLTPNVPIEGAGEDASDRAIVRGARGERLRHAVAFSGPLLAIGSFTVAPSVPMGLVAALHLTLYLFFRSVSVPKRPKDWGIVYEEGTRRPVPQAVLRMFALPYHKLIATYVSDPRGRYNFLVGPAEVYVTVSKDGYAKTETEPVDLKTSRGASVIATDLPLRPSAGEWAEDLTIVATGPMEQPGVLPAPPDASVPDGA